MEKKKNKQTMEVFQKLKRELPDNLEIPLPEENKN